MPFIFLVEDDLTYSTILSTWLRKKGFRVATASSVGAAVRTLLGEPSPPDLVLSDLRLPDHDGLYLLQWMRERNVRVPFIIMTGYAEVQNAVLAMKLGASDYIAKPVQPDLLMEKINDALRTSATPAPSESTVATREKTTPPAHGAKTHRAQGIEGDSEAARELYRYAALVAPTPMSVLIIGASGTGKEYVARRIHEMSAKAEGPFVALDCGALTKELAASELFGHMKGAFTGATADKCGAFEQATGGTLFLDEVGNLSYDVQVQLLRALQERRIRPVGSTEERTVDIRLVSATNENLPAAIARGNFREDLYHRINEFTLHVPLLRERGTDIQLFARHFLQQANQELNRSVQGFTPEAAMLLQSYPWPGNLREMRNVVVRATLLCPGTHIGADELTTLTHPLPSQATPAAALPRQAATSAVPATPPPQSHTLRSPDEERARICAALQQTGGNKSQAARLLGIDRKTLYNKLKALGLET